jgi:hypothetical protein
MDNGLNTRQIGDALAISCQLAGRHLGEAHKRWPDPGAAEGEPGPSGGSAVEPDTIIG